MIYPRNAEVEGATALFFDQPIAANPYPQHTEIADSWDFGWKQAFNIEIKELFPEL